MPRPRQGGRTDRKQGRGPSPASVLVPLLLIIGLVSAISYGWYMARKADIPIDELTNCPTKQGPSAVHVVLIDVTDELSALTRDEILQHVQRIQGKVGYLDRIEVFGLGPNDEGITEPLFAACNPGRVEDMNALYQNPMLAEKRWMAFDGKLEQALMDVVTTEESQRSPILEAIRRISVKTFGEPEFDRSEKFLYVFSDLLQHNPGIYSQYTRPLQSYEAFLSSGKHPTPQANLTGVQVEFFYLSPQKTRHLQGEEHIRFWESFVQKSGGTFGPRLAVRIHGGE